MSHVQGHTGAKRFQSTRRTSGGNNSAAPSDGSDGTQTKGETQAPKRTFGRTYLSRGFSGFKRPKRPQRTKPFGKPAFSAADELPGITRPALATTALAAPREGAQAASSRKFVATGCKSKGGYAKVPKRSELTSVAMRVVTTNEPGGFDLETDPAEIDPAAAE
jgi:hypothetical protein